MKKISLFIFTTVICLITFTNVHAASANISVSANKSRVIVGETVTVTIKVSSNTALGVWSFDVVPSSNLTLIDSSFGGLYIKDVVSNSNQTSKTYTFRFKANKSGTGSVAVKNSDVRDWNEFSMSVSNGSTSFKMMTQSEIEASYSKNNYLSSLEVEGYTLTPEFNKETLEYSLEVENDITSVNILAKKEDSTASIAGAGTVTLSEGVNPIKVVVTAQNGSTRTYTVNITVKELSPIIANVDGKNYTVIRKQEFMPKASLYFEESTISISGEEVPCYVNNTIHFTLIGLKDEAGNIGLFLYENGTYKPYQEFSFNQLAIYLVDMDETLIPKGYTKTTLFLGDTEVTAYQNKNREYSLLYGMNIENGEKAFYEYDGKENTLQRYLEIKDPEKQIYFYAVIGLFGFLVLTYLGIIIALIRNNKKNKERLERTMRMQKISSYSKETEDIVNQIQEKSEPISKKEQKKLEKQNQKQQKLEQKQKAEQEAKLSKQQQKEMRQEFLQDDEKNSQKEKKKQEKLEKEKAKQEAKRLELEQIRQAKEAKSKKLSKKQREALLGKTMIDITGIPFDEKDKKV